MPTDPAIIANLDFAGELDIVATGLNLSFVGGGEDADKGAEHDAVADGDDAAVEYYCAVRSVSSEREGLRRHHGLLSTYLKFE